MSKWKKWGLGCGVVVLAGVLLAACGEVPKKQLSVQEYAAACGAWNKDNSVEEGATWKELIEAVDERLSAAQGVVPPDELTEWHKKNLTLLSSMKSIAATQDQSEVWNPFAFFALIGVSQDLERIEGGLLEGNLRLLIEEGCKE